MQVKFKKAARISFDGCRVLEVKEGDIAPVPVNCEGVALDFIEKGYCEIFKEKAEAEPKEKKVKGAQNKNT